MEGEELTRVAEELSNALGDALMRTQRDWQPIPFLPLFVGTKRYRGEVNHKCWWSWEVRLTWVRERKRS